MSSPSDDKALDKHQNEEKEKAPKFFDVTVEMCVTSNDGEQTDTKKIDFGRIREDQLKGLTDLFSILASNVEYIRKLAPQYEKLDKTKPPYLY